MLIGLLLGLGGFLVNWYYEHKEDKRQNGSTRLEWGCMSEPSVPRMKIAALAEGNQPLPADTPA